MGIPGQNKYSYQDRSLRNRKGEEWEDIPFLDGAYHISNYGRVKSLKRWVQRASRGGYWVHEKILKIRVSTQVVSGGKRKLRRLSVLISFEKKKRVLSIARMVYYLYVKKFTLEDRGQVVSFIDEDPLNIHPENLVLTTPGKNISKAYKKKYRPRDAFGKKARPVSQFDMRGKWICTYPSVSEAGKQSGIESSSISECLSGKRTYAGKYLWSFKTDKKKISVPGSVKNKLASDKFHSTIISQYDLKGNKLREYPTLKAAAKAVKVKTNAIRAVILGLRLSAKKYYWKLGQGQEKIVFHRIEESIKNRKEKICRPVTQYDLQGKKIGFYPSLAEASRVLEITPGNIWYALRNEYNSISNGYIWSYGNGPERIKVSGPVKRKYSLQQLYEQKVTQYNMLGKRIAKYASVGDAARSVNVQVHGLIVALEGKALTFRGYLWRLGDGKASIDVRNTDKALQARVKKLSKPVIQFDQRGKKIAVYQSISAASRATHTSSSQIRNVAAGKFKPAKGFLWKLKE